jgi:hypothetical protein
MNQTYVRSAIAAAIAAVLACTGAACRTSGTSASSSAPAKTGTPSPTAQNLADKPAETILDEARKGLAGARFVHVKGSMIEKHQRFALDLRMARDSAMGGLTAPIKGHNVPMKIRMVDGKIYVSSRTMMRLLGGPAAADMLGDRWIVSTPKDMGVDDFISPAKFSTFLKLDKGETVSKGETTTIAGIPVVGLTAEDGVLYVATTGTPRPIRLTPLQHVRGQYLAFSDYDVPFTVKAPAHPIDANTGKTI